MSIEIPNNMEEAKSYLISRDPALTAVFNHVDNTGFKLGDVIKEPYPALVGAIIGQKITYKAAKAARGRLYQQYGVNFTPESLHNQDLSFVGAVPAKIIYNVTNYILANNIDLSTEDGIRSLINVNGIGPWTIDTTLLTCMKNWNIFPKGDKFLNKRMRMLYGNGYNEAEITEKWAPYKSIVTWYLWRWF